MLEKYLLGIDLGTTVCKAAVFDKHLSLAGRAECDLALLKLSENEIEQDASEWWEATLQVIRKAIQAAGIDSRHIEAIGIGSQGVSMVPVDGRCNPIRRAFSWLDNRATEEAREIAGELGEDNVFQTTGKRVTGSYGLAKVVWLRRHEPATYENAHKLLMPLDFLTARLTGRYLTDHTMASGTQYYDIRRQVWARRILDRFHIEDEKLPELRWSGTPAGTIRPDVAERLGLPDGTMIAVGGQDQKVAALGAGIESGVATVSLGTATAITQKCASAVVDSALRIPCCSYLFPNEWVLEGVIRTSCASLNWLKDTLFSELSFQDLVLLGADAENNRNELFFYPFLSGASTPFRKDEGTGFLYGITLSTTSGQIVRSVMEGIAFVIQKNLDVMKHLERPVDRIRIFGGGARSDVWCQIIADATNSIVETVSNPEAGCTGAAILAGLASGVFQSVPEALGRIQTGARFSPEPRMASVYRHRIREYFAVLQRVISPSRS